MNLLLPLFQYPQFAMNETDFLLVPVPFSQSFSAISLSAGIIRRWNSNKKPSASISNASDKQTNKQTKKQRCLQLFISLTTMPEYEREK